MLPVILVARLPLEGVRCEWNINGATKGLGDANRVRPEGLAVDDRYVTLCELKILEQ
jgi:hypothetical protein